jgi:hypothetical protein
MSRVAAIIVVGLCFLAGCRETPEPTKISAFAETNSKPNKSDIIFLTEPNDQTNLDKTLDSLVPLENQYFIIPVEPQPGVDYKIAAVKPNPNIDYKILNPMQNSKKLLQELQRQIGKNQSPQ